MNRVLLRVVPFLLPVIVHAGVQAQYKPQQIPEATLEGTRRAVEGLRQKAEPLPQAQEIVDNQFVEMAIAIDVLQQHQMCFTNAEATKAKKKELLDFELSEVQRKKFEVILSPSYRQELLGSPEFFGLKLGIASSLSASAPMVLSKAVELSKDEVGVDFVLAWIQPALREHIDKSCGRSPGEAVLAEWKGMFLWQRLAKRFRLN